MIAALRLGIFQLVYLDRVPDHAAVGESVELAKAESRGGAGLVNAVLRRAAREAAALVAELPDATPEQAALRHSHPVWVADLWWDTFGAETARALMAADNEPAEAALRANTLRITAVDLAQRLPVHTEPAGEDGLSCSSRLTRTPRPSGATACSCPSRAPRWPLPASSTLAPASACSTCAPRPAARRLISPR